MQNAAAYGAATWTPIFARKGHGRPQDGLFDAHQYPTQPGGLARAPVRGYDRTSENLILPSVWTCQNPTFHLVSKKLARADGVVVSHDRTKVVWCCVTKAQKKRNDGSSPEFSEQYARA